MRHPGRRRTTHEELRNPRWSQNLLNLETVSYEICERIPNSTWLQAETPNRGRVISPSVQTQPPQQLHAKNDAQDFKPHFKTLATLVRAMLQTTTNLGPIPYSGVKSTPCFINVVVVIKRDLTTPRPHSERSFLKEDERRGIIWFSLGVKVHWGFLYFIGDGVELSLLPSLVSLRSELILPIPWISRDFDQIRIRPYYLSLPADLNFVIAPSSDPAGHVTVVARAPIVTADSRTETTGVTTVKRATSDCGSINEINTTRIPWKRKQHVPRSSYTSTRLQMF